MRILPLLAAAALLAAPAAAQKLGERTSSPTQVLGEEATLDPEAEAEQIAATAALHPLGSLENPIRVGGPEGARAYIGRLRCTNESRPVVESRRAAGVGPYGTITERYALNCGDVAPGRTTLFFDFYHEEHVEKQAAGGFRID
ncbi:MAG: hypothetical protein QOJ91_428 [Sphingomonadales bacterium]|jgi:hypothetical protein|nr:hypothetical protein [Sphingomonadales bacterium]